MSSSVQTWKIFANKIPILKSFFFAKQRLITRARLAIQDYATGKNFCFNQCHNKEICVFSRES